MVPRHISVCSRRTWQSAVDKVNADNVCIGAAAGPESSLPTESLRQVLAETASIHRVSAMQRNASVSRRNGVLADTARSPVTKAWRLAISVAACRRDTSSIGTSSERAEIGQHAGTVFQRMLRSGRPNGRRNGSGQTQDVDASAMRAPCRRYRQSRPRATVVYNRGNMSSVYQSDYRVRRRLLTIFACRSYIL